MVAALDAPSDGIYPMSLPTSPAADRTHPAATRWPRTPQPASPPRSDYAASEQLSLRSLLKCTTECCATTVCVALTHTFNRPLTCANNASGNCVFSCARRSALEEGSRLGVDCGEDGM